MRTLFLGLVVALSLLSPPALAQDAERYGTQKVVYHVNGRGGDEGGAYLAALRNVQNHLDAVGEGRVEVAVVLHGDGLGLLAEALTNGRVQTSVASLKGQGVSFLVCENTLNGRGIPYEDDLYDVWEDDIVPSGVAELSRLQQMGYAYIRP